MRKRRMNSETGSVIVFCRSIVLELIGRRLVDVDERAAAQMLSRDLGHRRPPRPPEPLRFREAELRSTQPVGYSVPAPALRAARPARTGPVGDFRVFASSRAFSTFASDGRKLRSASISERKDCKISRENCGSAQIWRRAADSWVIQAGMQATDPSG